MNAIQEYLLQAFHNGHLKRKHKCPSPECSNRKKKSDKPLYVKLVDDRWILYKCYHCNQKGRIDTRPKPEKLNVLPTIVKRRFAPIQEHPLGDKVVSYFQSRGISKQTLIRHAIGVTKSRKTGKMAIAFPFYQSGKLVNVQYRMLDEKSFRMEPGCPSVWWNVDNAKSQEEVVITEGMIDAMTYYEKTGRFAVSLPNGKSNLKFNDEYGSSIIASAKRIIIATDSDVEDDASAEAISRRFGRHKCFRVTFPEGGKDFNDFADQPPEFFHRLVAEAKPYPVEGVIMPADMLQPALDCMVQDPKSSRVWINDLGDNFSFATGELTIITGIPGHGKSTMLDYLCVKIAQKAGWKFGMLSYEKFPFEAHIIDLAEKYSGHALYGKTDEQAMQILADSIEWIQDRFVFFNYPEMDTSIDVVCQRIEEVVSAFGLNCIVIDNLSFITTSDVTSSEQRGRDIMVKLNTLKRRYDLAIFLVIHPRKPPSEGRFVPGGYSPAGSAHYFNLTDNGITVFRDTDDTTKLFVWKIRNRFAGKRSVITFEFQQETCSFKAIDFDDTFR